MLWILLNIELKMIGRKMVAAAKDFQINVVIIHTNRLREDFLNLCTGRPPTGVMIPDAV